MDLKNHSLIKKINRAQILNTIRVNTPIARSHIAEKTGLDKKTMTNFVSEFIKEDLIEEFGKQEQSVGRPFTMLKFKKKLVMGIDIAPDIISGVLMDLYGNVHASHEIEYPLYSDREKVMNAVTKIYNGLKKVGPIYHGVGICMPGIIDTEKGIVKGSANMPSLQGLEYNEIFSAFITEPFFVEETSKTKAIAEKIIGIARDTNDFVVIEVGIGIGSGIIANRSVFKGAGKYAGEIGHIVIEPGGLPCRCGNRGCLEAYASEKMILERVNAILKTDYDAIESIKESEYPAIEDVIKDVGRKIGAGIGAMINIVNPTVIILNGPAITKFEDIILPAIEETVKNSCPSECCKDLKLRVSEFGKSAAPGAAALVLCDIFEVPGYYYV